jgi:hypothetical protein
LLFGYGSLMFDGWETACGCGLNGETNSLKRKKSNTGLVLPYEGLKRVGVDDPAVTAAS